MSDPTAVADVTLKLTGDGAWAVEEVDGGVQLTSPRPPSFAIQTGVRLILDRAAFAALLVAAEGYTENTPATPRLAG